jgi:ferredoxin/flavodoxin---NADP+ reductase
MSTNGNNGNIGSVNASWFADVATTNRNGRGVHLKTVFVVGAGPAGLFAAQKIAQAGHNVIILNRDIKPGGLAEYGIYPTKDKMKFGLRKQFAKVLSLPNVHYLGHVSVGKGAALSIEELRTMNPSAIVFAVGAQGTKKLGLTGSEARGVYSAKDFVYFYNLLPPFASQDFACGRRIAVVGMGNVAVDIAHWLLVDDPCKRTEEVIIVARRGPFEAKFDKKEFAYIEMHLDHVAFREELRRIEPMLTAVGQDIATLPDATFPVLKKPATHTPHPRLLFRFLNSPQTIHTGSDGQINRITLTENVLVQRDGDVAAKATDKTFDLEVDTMIFAIGDVADPALGLPYGKDSYVTHADPADPARSAYEVFDPQTGKVLEGIYVLGWARKASEGLVGIARHDGEVGAAHVLTFLEGVPDKTALSVEDIRSRVQSKGIRTVTKADLEHLARAEEREAQRRGATWFKFADDEAMLRAIDEEKSGKSKEVGV